jgi:pimeloyl-ACP methyl ester carboxylesterase
MIESADEFIRLRTSELRDEYWRAAHDEAPLEVWWQVVREHPDMKVWVIHNKTVPLEILTALSTDDKEEVREAVARKRKTPVEILGRLACDPEPGVRLAVACNAKAPRHVLELLANDCWETITHAAKRRLHERNAGTMGKPHVDDQGTGEPVILLHSHGLSGRQWRKLGGELVARGMRVLAVDLSGQGQSEPWPEPRAFSFEIDVERVTELLRAVQPAHLVGHSYGGLIALHVARAEPRALRTLSLFDPVAFSILHRDVDRDARAILDGLDLSWGDDRDRWLRTFVEFWGGDGAWGALREEARDEFRRVGWVIREGVRTLAEDQTAASAFAQVDVPTLLMTGEKSPMPARRVIERLAEAMPDARVEVVAGVGHLGPVTAAGEVNARVVARLTQ